MSPSVASSPVIGTFHDNIRPGRDSPIPLPAQPRPASSRARQNSAQSNNTENARQRPPSVASNKQNGTLPGTPDPGAQSNGTKVMAEPKAQKETVTIPNKPESARPDTETAIPPPEPPAQNGGNGKKDGITAKPTEEREPKKDPETPVVPPVPLIGTVKTTKSGRASKPSTPAMATFAEAAAAHSRSRPSRNPEGGGAGNGVTASATATATTTAKRSHKKGASISASAAAAAAMSVQAPPPAAEDPRKRSDKRDDDDDEADGDEPRYCFCNQVSYGEMVGCDAEGCPREWFHLECVGLEVAPKGKGKLGPPSRATGKRS
jgi:hypothetical protein